MFDLIRYQLVNRSVDRRSNLPQRKLTFTETIELHGLGGEDSAKTLPTRCLRILTKALSYGSGSSQIHKIRNLDYSGPLTVKSENRNLATSKFHQH